MRRSNLLLRRAGRCLSTSVVRGPKVYASADAAVADVPSGSTLLVGGFGLTGTPDNLIMALQRSGVSDLTVVSSNVGTKERGLGPLFATKQISKVVGAYVGENDTFESQFLEGQIEVELVPMGTLAERMRAAGAGIPAFYTHTGVGTLVHHGGMPMRYSSDGKRQVVLASVSALFSFIASMSDHSFSLLSPHSNQSPPRYLMVRSM